MTAPAPDPHFRDQLAEVLREHQPKGWDGDRMKCRCGHTYTAAIGIAPHQAAEVEARIQASANQRAAEELRAMADERERLADHYEAPTGAPVRDEVARLRARAAALASPAPAPRAEEGR